jgi:hypothetical protein
LEDKWFIYLEEDWLYIHRSWTGNCIHQVRFASEDTQHRIAEAWVNRDQTQYVEVNDKTDVDLLLKLIDWLIQGDL